MSNQAEESNRRCPPLLLMPDRWGTVNYYLGSPKQRISRITDWGLEREAASFQAEGDILLLRNSGDTILISALASAVCGPLGRQVPVHAALQPGDERLVA